MPDGRGHRHRERHVRQPAVLAHAAPRLRRCVWQRVSDEAAAERRKRIHASDTRPDQPRMCASHEQRRWQLRRCAVGRHACCGCRRVRPTDHLQRIDDDMPIHVPDVFEGHSHCVRHVLHDRHGCVREHVSCHGRDVRQPAAGRARRCGHVRTVIVDCDADCDARGHVESYSGTPLERPCYRDGGVQQIEARVRPVRGQGARGHCVAARRRPFVCEQRGPELLGRQHARGVHSERVERRCSEQDTRDVRVPYAAEGACAVIADVCGAREHWRGCGGGTADDGREGQRADRAARTQGHVVVHCTAGGLHVRVRRVRGCVRAPHAGAPRRGVPQHVRVHGAGHPVVAVAACTRAGGVQRERDCAPEHRCGHHVRARRRGVLPGG
eukprot:PhM_4_TR11615/c0_g1_i1/m.9847